MNYKEAMGKVEKKKGGKTKLHRIRTTKVEYIELACSGWLRNFILKEKRMYCWIRPISRRNFLEEYDEQLLFTFDSKEGKKNKERNFWQR